MIKALLFDFDGVLTVDKTGSQSILNYISKATDIPFNTLKEVYYPYNKGLLYGEFTHAEIWETFCEKIGRVLDCSILIDSYRNTPIDMEMIDLIKESKPSYKIGMITDNKIDRIEEIITYFGWENLFDTISISAAYKSGKDSRLIFDRTIERLAVLPEECVFIDNTAKNLIVPQKLGMKTILFDDEHRDIQRFRMILQSILAKSE